MGSGNNHNQKGSHLKTEDQVPDLKPVITNSGARKIFNFVYDVLNDRKTAANFVYDKEQGRLLEATSGKEIEVIFKPEQEK